MIQRISISTSGQRWRFSALLIGITLALSCLNIALPAAAQHTIAQAAETSATIPVHRWWHDGDKDWVSIPADDSQPSDATMTAWGYTNKSAPQYYVNTAATDPGMVAVHRWWHDGDKDWVDIRDGSISDATMTAWGYTNKTFQFYAYTTSAAGRVAINRWWHDGDKDWVTIRQGEVPDATMTAWGYTNKTFLVYAYASPV